MKKSGILVFGILSILIVVAVSGCTSNTGNTSSSPNYKNDIELYAVSYDYYPQDGSGGGGVAITNHGNVTYTKVKINLEIFDEKGNSIANETKVLGKLSAGEEVNWFQITDKAYKKGTSASATVIEATPA